MACPSLGHSAALHFLTQAGLSAVSFWELQQLCRRNSQKGCRFHPSRKNTAFKSKYYKIEKIPKKIVISDHKFKQNNDR